MGTLGELGVECGVGGGGEEESAVRKWACRHPGGTGGDSTRGGRIGELTALRVPARNRCNFPSSSHDSSVGFRRILRRRNEVFISRGVR